MGDKIAISDEASAALIEWGDARDSLYDCEKRFRDAETTLNWMTQDSKHFREMSDFDLKDFNAIEDAYILAYNDGHRDGRNSAGYNPKIQKLDREAFREAYKMRAESFEAITDEWLVNLKRSNPLSRHYIPSKSAEEEDWDDEDDATWDDNWDPQAFFESVWESWQDDWMSGEANENVVNEIAEAVVKNDPAGNLVIEDNYGWYLELSNEQREDLLTKPYLQEIIDEDIERMGESWGDQFMSEDYRWENCDKERSFLISILSDRQLDEFLQFEEDSYSAETKLVKQSCCCGATEDKPCRCMKDGPMNCSAVEPKCPCYQDLEKNAESDAKWDCVICGHKSTGYGHNPDPVALKGRCCDTCNSTIVIPNRIMHTHLWHKKKADYTVDVGGPYGARYTGTIKEVKEAEEDCPCPVCGTTTEVIREWYNDDTAYVDLVVCDNCYWMEELGENDEEYDAYMEQMLAMVDDEPHADLLEKPNVVVDTSWDWSDGVGPPSSQQTLDLDFEATSQHDIHTEPMMIDNPEYIQPPWNAGNPNPSSVEPMIKDPSGKQVYICFTCHTISEGTPITGPCLGYQPPKKPTGTCPHCKEEVDHVGTAQVFYCPACHEDLGPSDIRGDDEPADWAKDVGLLEAEGEEELTDEEKQEVWNVFQEEAASLEDPNLEQIKTLADKYLTDVIDDEVPEFFVDPGLEDYYQYILTDPTYPEGGEPEDEEAAAMFEELKQVRYWATILTDRHVEEADTAAKAMIAAGIMGGDEKLLNQGMLGLETNNQVQRERELLAQWLAEGGVHEN